MAVRKLGLLLSTAPSHPSVETVVQLAQAALRRKIDVYIYLIDDGVKMSVCAYGCQQHDVPTATVDSRVSLSGLVVLSGIIDGCDRFLAFT